MSHYPLEALLRPPVEYGSAATAGSAAFVMAVAPTAWMMEPAYAYLLAAGLALLACRRLGDGNRIRRYQRNLLRQPDYRVTADAIPVSRDKLFLGKGFEWTQTHTQRLVDTKRPMARRYLEPSRAYRIARDLETRWEHHAIFAKLTPLLSRDVWWNPVRPLPDTGGKAVLHGIEPDERDVWMWLRERTGHTLVKGTTRVGKTRLAEVLIAQDIRRGDVVLVFDPKGDAELMKRVVAEAIRSSRQNELFIFHLGHPEISARYNPIASFSRITEVATRTANQLPQEGNAAAFREFAWLFSNIVARTVVALGQRPDYNLLTRYIRKIEPLLVEYYRHWLGEVAPMGWERQVMERAGKINDKDLPFELKGRSHEVIALVEYAKESGLRDPIADGLRTVFAYDKKYYDKLVVSLQPLMEKLISGKSAELIAPNYANLDDPRPIFDWMQVIRRKGIVYVGLDALSDYAVAQAVGNSMFADLVSVAGHLYKHGISGGLPEDVKTQQMPVIDLHADEFNELIGPEFIPMVNKAGGAGFRVTAYTQTLSDIEARIGSAARAGQVIGNFNTTIMFRVKELATAELLTSQLDEVMVKTTTEVSGVTDASDATLEVDFTSRNEDRHNDIARQLITPADVMALPKGQAFVLMEGGHLWKVRLPLPDPSNDPAMPQSIAEAANAMLKKYAAAGNWWLDADEWRGHIPETLATRG